MKTMTYGDWLRAKRKQMGISQEQLGDITGKHRTHINRIENGGIELPDDNTRFQIHRALGTTEDDLVEAGVLIRMDFAGGPLYMDARSVPESDMGLDLARRIADRHDHDAYDALDGAGSEAVLVRTLRAYGLTARQVAAVLAVVDAFVSPTDD